MSDDDIDLDRVVVDPDYRRRVIEFLRTTARADGEGGERIQGAQGPTVEYPPG